MVWVWAGVVWAGKCGNDGDGGRMWRGVGVGMTGGVGAGMNRTGEIPAFAGMTGVGSAFVWGVV